MCDTPPVGASRWHALLLTALGLGLVVGPLAWRLSRPATRLERGLALAAVGLYVAWVALESRISAREVRQAEPDQGGRSMEAAAAAKIALLMIALLVGGSPRPEVAGPGLAALVGGVALRTWAIASLGGAYSHRIRLPQAVIAAGPYRWLRHPAYAGTLVAHLGVALVFANAWSLGAWAALWLPAVVWRVVVEERCLAASQPWREYAQGRRRLLPGLW